MCALRSVRAAWPAAYGVRRYGYSEGARLITEGTRWVLVSYVRGALELREKQGGAFGLPRSFLGRCVAYMRWPE